MRIKKEEVIRVLRKTRPRTCELFGKSRVFTDKKKQIPRKQKYKNQET